MIRCGGSHRFLGPLALAASLLSGACWLVLLGGFRSDAQAARPAVTAPNDPLFRYQWHLRDIQIPRAWAVSRGAGAVVAVDLDPDGTPVRARQVLAGTRAARLLLEGQVS